MIPDDRHATSERIASALGIRRRVDWSLLRPDRATMAEDWNYRAVVIHHSGNSGETDPRAVESLHMHTRGWDDIGYHYLVDADGALYEGRYLAYKGSHVADANTGKIGILIMGDFEHQWWDFDDDPTRAQLDSAVRLIATLQTAFATLVELGGHCDYKPSTRCPGGALYPRLDDIRARTGLRAPARPRG